jgi:hypothetical protein
MNMEERQHAVQAPHGTAGAAVPDSNETSAPRSHSEKSPAGTARGWLIFGLIESSAIATPKVLAYVLCDTVLHFFEGSPFRRACTEDLSMNVLESEFAGAAVHLCGRFGSCDGHNLSYPSS